MIFESFFNYLNFKNKNELLASTEEHGELKLINKGIRCGVHLWHYDVEIIGMEGKSDNWNISLANYKHKPKESISVIGFASATTKLFETSTTFIFLGISIYFNLDTNNFCIIIS
jgi:hypothetical protein